MPRRASSAILRLALRSIEDESRWVRDAVACSAAGVPCDPLGPDAVRWSSYGAVIAAGGDPRGPEAAALDRAANRLFGCGALAVDYVHGHARARLVLSNAVECAVLGEVAAGLSPSRVGVAGAAGGADHPPDHVLGLDQGGRAADVRPVGHEGDRAHAQAFLQFLEYLRPQLRLPLAERPGQVMEQGAEQKERDPFGLVDHFVVFLHERYSRMAAGETIDEAAPASRSSPPPPAWRERVAADLALAQARRAAARCTDQHHRRGEDTADDALALMAAADEAARAYAAAGEALRRRWERG